MRKHTIVLFHGFRAARRTGRNADPSEDAFKGEPHDTAASLVATGFC